MFCDWEGPRQVGEVIADAFMGNGALCRQWWYAATQPVRNIFHSEGNTCHSPYQNQPDMGSLLLEGKSRMIEIKVIGLPAPQGSKRHVGHGVMIESSNNVKPWREA